ncbi:hypothetical protein DXG01_004359 [Tephrocybe rancida]|nr:hypothetical protein DXG01_004359 [Tephrocybe rancida]
MDTHALPAKSAALRGQVVDLEAELVDVKAERDRYREGLSRNRARVAELTSECEEQATKLRDLQRRLERYERNKNAASNLDEPVLTSSSSNTRKTVTAHAVKREREPDDEIMDITDDIRPVPKRRDAETAVKEIELDDNKIMEITVIPQQKDAPSAVKQEELSSDDDETIELTSTNDARSLIPMKRALVDPSTSKPHRSKRLKLEEDELDIYASDARSPTPDVRPDNGEEEDDYRMAIIPRDSDYDYVLLPDARRDVSPPPTLPSPPTSPLTARSLPPTNAITTKVEVSDDQEEDEGGVEDESGDEDEGGDEGESEDEDESEREDNDGDGDEEKVREEEEPENDDEDEALVEDEDEDSEPDSSPSRSPRQSHSSAPQFHPRSPDSIPSELRAPDEEMSGTSWSGSCSPEVEEQSERDPHGEVGVGATYGSTLLPRATQMSRNVGVALQNTGGGVTAAGGSRAPVRATVPKATLHVAPAFGQVGFGVRVPTMPPLPPVNLSGGAATRVKFGHVGFPPVNFSGEARDTSSASKSGDDDDEPASALSSRALDKRRAGGFEFNLVAAARTTTDFSFGKKAAAATSGHVGFGGEPGLASGQPDRYSFSHTMFSGEPTVIAGRIGVSGGQQPAQRFSFGSTSVPDQPTSAITGKAFSFSDPQWIAAPLSDDNGVRPAGSPSMSPVVKRRPLTSALVTPNTSYNDIAASIVAQNHALDAYRTSASLEVERPLTPPPPASSPYQQPITPQRPWFARRKSQGKIKSKGGKGGKEKVRSTHRRKPRPAPMDIPTLLRTPPAPICPPALSLLIPGRAIRKWYGGVSNIPSTITQAKKGRAHVFLKADNCPVYPVAAGAPAIALGDQGPLGVKRVRVFVNKKTTLYDYLGEYGCFGKTLKVEEVWGLEGEFRSRFVTKHLLPERRRWAHIQGEEGPLPFGTPQTQEQALLDGQSSCHIAMLRFIHYDREFASKLQRRLARGILAGEYPDLMSMDLIADVERIRAENGRFWKEQEEGDNNDEEEEEEEEYEGEDEDGWDREEEQMNIEQDYFQWPAHDQTGFQFQIPFPLQYTDALFLLTMEREYKALLARTNELEAQVIDLEEELKDVKRERNQFRETLSTNRTRVADLTSENEALASELRDVRRQLERIQKKNNVHGRVTASATPDRAFSARPATAMVVIKQEPREDDDIEIIETCQVPVRTNVGLSIIKQEDTGEDSDSDIELIENPSLIPTAPRKRALVQAPEGREPKRVKHEEPEDLQGLPSPIDDPSSRRTHSPTPEADDMTLGYPSSSVAPRLKSEAAFHASSAVLASPERSPPPEESLEDNEDIVMTSLPYETKDECVTEVIPYCLEDESASAEIPQSPPYEDEDEPVGVEGEPSEDESQSAAADIEPLFPETPESVSPATSTSPQPQPPPEEHFEPPSRESTPPHLREFFARGATPARPPTPEPTPPPSLRPSTPRTRRVHVHHILPEDSITNGSATPTPEVTPPPHPYLVAPSDPVTPPARSNPQPHPRPRKRSNAYEPPMSPPIDVEMPPLTRRTLTHTTEESTPGAGPSTRPSEPAPVPETTSAASIESEHPVKRVPPIDNATDASRTVDPRLARRARGKDASGQHPAMKFFRSSKPPLKPVVQSQTPCAGPSRLIPTPIPTPTAPAPVVVPQNPSMSTPVAGPSRLTAHAPAPPPPPVPLRPAIARRPGSSAPSSTENGFADFLSMSPLAINPPPDTDDLPIQKQALAKFYGGAVGRRITFTLAKHGRRHLFLDAENCPHFENVEPGDPLLVFVGHWPSVQEVTVFMHYDTTYWTYGGEYECRFSRLRIPDFQDQDEEFKSSFIRMKYLLDKRYHERRISGDDTPFSPITLNDELLAKAAITNGEEQLVVGFLRCLRYDHHFADNLQKKWRHAIALKTFRAHGSDSDWDDDEDGEDDDEDGEDEDEDDYYE